MRHFSTMFLPLLAWLLAACASQLADPRLVEPEGSEQFVAGYRHGCLSGQHKVQQQIGFHVRDPDRYGSDEEYTRGWDEGMSLCHAQQQRYPKMLGGGGEM